MGNQYYRYGGTEFDAHLPITGPLPPRPDRQPRKPAVCGTRAGFQAHKRAGETPCQPCRDADNAYGRERYYARQRARWAA